MSRPATTRHTAAPGSGGHLALPGTDGDGRRFPKRFTTGARRRGADPALGSLGRLRGPAFRPAVLSGVQRMAWRLAEATLTVSLLGRENIPATGPVLLAGNHASFLDGPLVAGSCPRPVRYLIKAELFVGPLTPALLLLGQIPVHRGRPDRSALREAVAELERGGVVGMFPEGSRGSGQLEQVQHGVAYLALRTGVPIVPVACVGTALAMPYGARRPVWRAPVSVSFGEAFQLEVPTNRHARRAVAAAAEEIRLRLHDHVREAQRQR